MIEFEITMKLVNRLNVYEHWRTRSKRVKREHDAIKVHFRKALGRKKKPQLPITIELTRYASIFYDRHDNLPASFKNVTDTLCAELGFDDRSDELTVIYKQEKSKRGDYRIKVKVSETMPQELSA